MVGNKKVGLPALGQTCIRKPLWESNQHHYSESSLKTTTNLPADAWRHEFALSLDRSLTKWNSPTAVGWKGSESLEQWHFQGLSVLLDWQALNHLKCKHLCWSIAPVSGGATKIMMQSWVGSWGSVEREMQGSADHFDSIFLYGIGVPALRRILISDLGKASADKPRQNVLVWARW